MAENPAKDNLKNETPASGGKTGLGGVTGAIYTELSRHLMLFAGVLAVLLGVSGYSFLIKPKYDEIHVRIDEANEAKRLELDDLNSYHTKLARYVADFESISADDKRMIEAMFPKNPEREKLFTSIEVLIKKQGMILASLDISADEPKAKKGAEAAATGSGAEKIRLTMNIAGVDYRGLKKLLAALENNLNLIDIDKLSWSPSENAVTLEAGTYFFK